VEEDVPAAPPVPGTIIDKVIFYAIYASQLFFKVLDSMSSMGGRIKHFCYWMMALPGFRHISLFVHFFLDPVYNFFKSIAVGFYALLLF